VATSGAQGEHRRPVLCATPPSSAEPPANAVRYPASGSMYEDTPAGLRRALDRLAGVLLSEESLDAVLALVAELAKETIPGADEVSVSLIGEPSDQTPPRCLSVPLTVDQRPLGMLRVYSETEGALDETPGHLVEAFAGQASVVLANALAYTTVEQQNAQLYDALASRETIGKAIGILMEREGLTDEEAFSMLRAASQNSNIKLRDIASELLARTKASNSHQDA
jgi:GAF domain-containing protein